jgi:hypothetical protein
MSASATGTGRAFRPVASYATVFRTMDGRWAGSGHLVSWLRSTIWPVTYSRTGGTRCPAFSDFSQRT